MTWLPKSVVCLTYYDRYRFRSDLIASSVLALEIFAACFAVAIASGLPPVYGVSSAVVASFVASAFGDSKIRISAPSVVLISAASSVVARHGIVGLPLATLLAGVLLAFFGAIRFGAAIQMLPRAVTLGFSTGIAVVVITKQLPNLFGTTSQISSEGIRWGLLSVLRLGAQADPRAIGLGLAALILIVVSRRALKQIPVGLAAMVLVSLLVKLAHLPVLIVGGLYATPFSWHLTIALRPDLLRGIISQAFAIAVLVAIESLQTMNLASRLTGERLNPNGELIVHGGVNIATALVGGLPACGNSFYSSQNALLGAQTPVSGILQSVFLVGFLLLFVPFLPFVPLPLVSALVLSIVCGMTHWRELSRVIKRDHTDLAAWLSVSVLTIVDLAAGIAVGMLVGMFLYMREQRAIRLGETF